LTGTKGAAARALALWMAGAKRSLPVPLSPRIITGASVSATRRAMVLTLEISLLSPTMSSNEKRAWWMSFTLFFSSVTR